MAIIIGMTPWQRDYWLTTPEGASCAAAIAAAQYPACALGTTAPAGCGRIICKSGGIAWIVAPSCSEVGRTWYCRNDAVTTACACTTSTTWFIPTCCQLLNPGYCCRVYWDSYSSTGYWSSTERFASGAWYVRIDNGIVDGNNKTYVNCARAFRCVTY